MDLRLHYATGVLLGFPCVDFTVFSLYGLRYRIVLNIFEIDREKIRDLLAPPDSLYVM